jgi:cyclopropane fatty-acyl-phospholipid synthase-like methyltransferase
MQKIGSHDSAHFVSAQTALFHEIATRLALTQNSVVVDIGCGCGRLAIPFAFLLRAPGAYYGIDVWAEGIAWCQDVLAQRYSTLHFRCLDAASNYYFDRQPNYRVKNDFKLDFLAPESVDGVFAISVFTHLTREDVQSYLNEIGRILRPKCAAYVTAFIIDDFFHDYVCRTGKHKAVIEREPGCFYAYQGQDHFAGFSMETWGELVAQAGLRIVSSEMGKWAEKPGGRTFQDTFILVRS